MICKHCEALGHATPQEKKCFFDPKKMMYRKEWAQELMKKMEYRARTTNDGGGRLKQ